MSEQTILDEIVVAKHQEVADRKRSVPLHEMEVRARQAGTTRVFLSALKSGNPAVIAEIKKASPSKGIIRSDFEPEAIAQSYEQCGATCLSVLTDRDYFQGSIEALNQARQATRLPVLRKDFIVDEYQIYETRALPADCLLLIVSTLDDVRLRSFHQLAKEIGLTVLLEVHDEAELDRALSVNPALIGINNRNLRTFSTDLATTERLAKLVPPEIQVVSESGIHTKDHVRRILACGVTSFLVGEAFMREPVPGHALRRMFYSTDSSDEEVAK